MAHPGEYTLVALGPLTNVALALTLEPRIAGALAELIVMGGAVLTHGNVTEVATANLYNDPEAAAIVYQSGAPVVQVGMDVCQQVIISAAQLERIQQTSSATTQLLARLTPHLMQSYVARGFLPAGAGVHYNDVPAMAYAIVPELFASREYHVRIATHDVLTRGQTVTDTLHRWGLAPNAKVVMGVNATALAEVFTTRVTAYQATPAGLR
jgi:inosine-uridine nucleoside N-ribohydrolase